MRPFPFFAAAAAIGLTAASLAHAALAAMNVSQKNRRFAPDTVTVGRGDTLRILNDDRFTHHIFFEDNGEKFDSGPQKPGESIELTFRDGGIYNLRCAIHPKMKLEVTVPE